MADRVERLTNLLALLLETRQPLSLVEIAGELHGQYPESHAARRGAFERDKAALREIGVPIDQEIVAGGEYAGQTKYWIDRARYELDELQLDDDEMRALQVAMAATRSGSASGQEAMWKLGAGMLEGAAPIAAVISFDSWVDWRTFSRRSIGSATLLCNDANIPETRLPAVPASPSVRTEIGAKAESETSGSSPWYSR